MILTLTMNPAIDKTVSVNNFTLDRVNRIQEVKLDAAGKGINVSKVVKVLGGKTKTFAFLGGQNGQYIKTELDKEKISLVNVSIEGETRVNTKIVDHKNQTFTDLNEKGPKVTQDHLKKFYDHVVDYSTSQSVVVLTGSVPPGIDSDVYKVLIERLKGFGVTTVLDATGDLFKEAIHIGPTVVKPNHEELEAYVGHELNEDQIITTSKTFLENGTKIVAVSQGSEGALFITKEGTFKAKGLKVDVLSTVGAGDAMVAGICYGLDKQLPIKDIIALSVACSAAQVTVEGTAPATLDLIYKLAKVVDIERLGE